MRGRGRITLSIILFLVSVNGVSAQTTAFTYQGKLSDGAEPASGNYDFQFNLFDTATVGTGTRKGPTITDSSVQVTAGIFTVQLDFGLSALSGAPRFLEISVRPTGSPDSYTVLSPRQPVMSAPYSVRSLNSSVADVLSSACIGCVTSAQVGSVSGSAVTGLIPVTSVPAGSGNYVQNATSQQAASNFNIDGNGSLGGMLSANSVTSATQFNIGVHHVLSLGSSTGIFAGRLAGASNTTGSGNSFFGDSAGRFNTNASNNSFFGRDTGLNNAGPNNSFFGAFSGDSNTTGNDNSFFGSQAGTANSTGVNNSFFGRRAGLSNTSANENAFFGFEAGMSNTTGSSNAFFGGKAGRANTTGLFNTFFGHNSRLLNTDSDKNSFFGAFAGAVNTGTQNSFFGSQSGESNTTGCCNSFFGDEAGRDNTTGVANTFLGRWAGRLNTTGSGNIFIGSNTGFLTKTGTNNVFIGASSNAFDDGDNVTLIGASTHIASGFSLQFATAIGAGAEVTSSNTIQLGRTIGFDTVFVPGLIRVNGLGVAGSTDVCRNASNLIATCSSSLRYKTGVRAFTGGLDIVRRLRPITFNWKDGGMRDVGFGAEEVEKIEPLLTTRNDKGEIEGVKYGQITSVLVNAIQQQQQIIERQQKQINALKTLACLSYPNAEICR